MFEPYNPLYKNLQCLSGTGIAYVKQDRPFHIFVDNFGEHAVDLLQHQGVAYATQHPETIVESDITNPQMLGLIPDDVDTKFCKRYSGIATIHKHLAGQREQHMGQDEKPATVEDLQLDVPHDKEEEIRSMLRKNERMWPGQVVEINIAEMRIYLVPDAKPFKSPPHRVRPKTRELEHA